MDSRHKIKFRSYGLTSKEAKEAVDKLKENTSKPINVHCGYMDYHNTDVKQQNIIEEAKRLGLVGKHAGSKPLHKLHHHIKVMQKMIFRYTSALAKMQRIKDQLENKENAD